MIIECKLTFESAHRNLAAAETDPARRLHGHSYEATVAVKGDVDPAIGWVMDFAEVKDRASEVIDKLDHRILNDIEGIGNASRDNVERWLNDALCAHLPTFHECKLRILGDRQWPPVVTKATEGRERVRFGFDAAHFLPTLPEAHKCRRVHGHSFRVAVTSKNAMNLAEPLREIYELVDHRLLNDLPGLRNPTSELLAQWLDSELGRRRCNWQEIMVAETCTSSCHLIASQSKN